MIDSDGNEIICRSGRIEIKKGKNSELVFDGIQIGGIAKEIAFFDSKIGGSEVLERKLIMPA